ncbi:MAG: hypothetical protein A2V59_11955 [Armatimonadetes bacterium RBG_19FT_COMBO_69_19]|nr:MAG: hypothetical protein A2V59_11955 [Armatimonadetes bacterium RBG_19FT_COMBO_69_19]
MTTLPETLTRALYAALRQVRHYGPQHPAAEESIRVFESAVRSALAQAPAVRWDVSADWLIVQGALLPADDRHGLPLRDHLTSRGVAHLTITAEADPRALREVIRLLSREPEEVIASGGASDALRRAGVVGIEVEGPEQTRALPAETDEYLAALSAAAALSASVERGDRLDVGRVQLVVETLDPSGGAARALWTQVVLRGHDELDPPHAVNVAFLAMQLARGLGLARPERIDLGVAAFLHDIGMARLPWQDRLAERTRTVRSALPRHAVEAGLLLRHLDGRSSLPMIAAMEHHRVIVEGPSTAAPASQLVALADYVEAMTCGRVGGLRPAGLGGLVTALLAGEGPAFPAVHVRVLAAVLVQAAASGVEVVPQM